jgi:anti-sigma factor RsiW
MTVQSQPSARCRKLLMEISRYLDGDLTPARQRMVEQHVRACACCGTMAARLRRTVAACRAEGGRRQPREVRSRAEIRIKALVAKLRAASMPRRPRLSEQATSRQSASAKVTHRK